MMKEALKRTAAWGLECPASHYTGEALERAPSGQRIGKVFDFYRLFEEYSRNFPFPPEIRANACAEVHPMAAAHLMSLEFPHFPCLTIGDVFWSGDSCFRVEEARLRDFLDAGPSKEHGVAFHAWLTFPDLTIYDLSFVPWQCRQNREYMDRSDEGGLGLFGVSEDMVRRAKIEHRPFLIGPELLWRTTSSNPMTEANYRRAEATWLAAPPPLQARKAGRNDPCPCGSGKKFKKCCES